MLLVKELNLLACRFNRIPRKFNRHSNVISKSVNKKYCQSYKSTNSTNGINLCRNFSTRVLKTDIHHDQQSLDHLNEDFRHLNETVKKFGNVYKKQIDGLHTKILLKNDATPIQALFLLQCCGNTMCTESTENRNKLVSNIWDSLQKLNVALDISHYNALLNIYIENRTIFSPLEFLATLKDKNLEPNRVTFSKIIEKFCQDGNIEGANEILSFMKNKDLTITKGVFHSLILGNSRSNDFEGAISILEIMEESNMKPVTETFSTLFQVYAEHGNKEELMKLLQRYDENEIVIDGSHFLEIIYNLAEQNKLEFIPEILSRLENKNSGYYIHACNNIIRRLVHIGHYELSYQLINMLPNEQNSSWNYFFQESAYSNTVPIEKLAEYCNNLKHSDAVIGAYEHSLKGYILSENIDNAVNIVKIMRDKNLDLRENYFYPIFTMLKKNKDSLRALTFFEGFKNEIPLNNASSETFIFTALVSSKEDIDSKYSKLSSQISNSDESAMYTFFLSGILSNFGVEEAANFANKYRKGALFTLTTPLMKEYFSNFDAKNTVCVLRQLLPFDIRSGNPKHLSHEWENRLFKGITDFLYRTVNKLVYTKQEEHLTDLLQAMLEERIRIIDFCKNSIIKDFDHALSVQHKELLTELSNPSLIPKVGRSKNYSYDMNVPLDLVSSFDQYISEGNLEEAEKLFNTLNTEYPHFQVKSNSILNYAYTLVKAGRIQDVVEVLRISKGRRTQSVNINVLLEELSEGNYDFSTMQNILEVLIENDYGVHAQILSYNTKYYINKHELDKAVEHYLVNMEKFHYTSFKNQLLKKLITDGQMERVQEITDQTIKLHGKQQCFLDLIFAFLELEKFGHVQRLLTSSNIARSFMRKKFEERCIHYVNQKNADYILNLIQISKDLMGNDREFLYISLLDVLIANKDTESALNTWLELQDEGILASDQFLIKLGEFLESQNVDVPFLIPSMILQKLDKIKDDLSSGKKVNHQELKEVIEKLAVQNDTVNLEVLGNYLTDKDNTIRIIIKQRIALCYIADNRLDEYFEKLEKYSNDKEHLFSVPSSWSLMDIVERYPDYIPQVKKCCLNLAERGVKTHLIVLLNKFIILGKLDEAKQIFDNNYSEDPVRHLFKFASSIAVRRNETKLLDDCVHIIGKASGMEVVRGAIVSSHIDILCNEKAYNEALEIVEKALSENLELSHLSRKSLLNLKKVAIEADILFPYDVSNLQKSESNEISRRNSSSSSSSSEDD